jgi:hypothetical protein
LFDLFRRLEASAYFTTGNHESSIDTNRTLRRIGQSGQRISCDETFEIQSLQLIGLEYMNADRDTYDSHMVNDSTIEVEPPKIIRD